MKILGLDISSNSTGWGIIETDPLKLLEYGLVKSDGSMGVTQRLYFFGNEIKKIIDKFQPDEIAIEETILVRGPKIMRTLARFSGVAIYLAYCYQKHEIQMHEPSKWKKGIGLSGSAVKPEVQLKVCEKFCLLDSRKVEDYKKQLEETDQLEKSIDSSLSKDLREKIKKLDEDEKAFKIRKKEIKNKKKKEVTEFELKELVDTPLIFEKARDVIKDKKKQINDQNKIIDKRYHKISTDIYSDAGINNDIADAIAIALFASIIHEEQKL